MDYPRLGLMLENGYSAHVENTRHNILYTWRELIRMKQSDYKPGVHCHLLREITRLGEVVRYYKSGLGHISIYCACHGDIHSMYYYFRRRKYVEDTSNCRPGK